MLSRNRILTVGAVLSMAVVWPRQVSAQHVRAQDDVSEQAIVLYGAGGGFNTLAHLDDAGATNFKTGFNVGGGVAYQANKYVALRGNFTFARAEAQSSLIAPGFAGTKFNRFLYDADLQFRYPFASGAAPYVFVGGGGVTVKQDVTGDQPTFTKGAGKFGVGLSYQIPRSKVGLYAEGTTWVYKWDRYGFDKTQFDTTWSGGISYRFGI